MEQDLIICVTAFVAFAKKKKKYPIQIYSLNWCHVYGYVYWHLCWYTKRPHEGSVAQIKSDCTVDVETLFASAADKAGLILHVWFVQESPIWVENKLKGENKYNVISSFIFETEINLSFCAVSSLFACYHIPCILMNALQHHLSYLFILFYLLYITFLCDGWRLVLSSLTKLVLLSLVLLSLTKHT